MTPGPPAGDAPGESQGGPAPLDPAELASMPLLPRTRLLMQRWGLRPVKSLGQNFLVDGNVAAKLCHAVLGLAPGLIVEIGPGLGALTMGLAAAGTPLVAFEKDRKLGGPLSELLAGRENVQVRLEDFLEADLSALARADAVFVGNLPYYITTPILERLFALELPPRGIVATMQREVAQRIQAGPGSKDYGSLTVFCQYHIEQVRTISRLGPGVFLPEPSVASTALLLIPRTGAPEGVASPRHFFAGVRAAFGYRRKTLKKALATAPQIGLSGEQVLEVLGQAGIAADRRGDTLGFGEFVALGNALAGREVGP